MLRVTIELFPQGSVVRSILLSQDYIINDGSGTVEHGNYKIEAGSGKLSTVFIKKYKRSKGHRLLVAKALQALDKLNNE